VQAHYERIRADFLANQSSGAAMENERLVQGGLYRLLRNPPALWTVDVCEAPAPRWQGARDPHCTALRDVMRWLLARFPTSAVEEVS
jgi:hypothetical protein